jgi:hypothetical protein
MSIKIPFVRKKMSTLLALSIAILMLMATSPVLLPPLSNFLLQPVQAQTTFTFKTPTPSTGTAEGQPVTLTFQGHGTISPNGGLENLAGDYEMPNFQKGTISAGRSTNEGGRVSLDLDLMSDDPDDPEQYRLTTSCGDSGHSVASVWSGPGGSIRFDGPVECSSSSSSQGGGNTASPSQMTGTTTTTKDSDSDGIPDSSDNCPNHPHHRCYKVGDTSTDQQQPSSSMTGTTTQDSDGNDGDSSSSTDSNSDSDSKDSDSDGIPNSSDNCPNHPHHRCYKVGDTSTTSTDQQQPSSSSSNGNGNQTGQ